METCFWLRKGDIPNEKIRLPPLEVHFGVGGEFENSEFQNSEFEISEFVI